MASKKLNHTVEAIDALEKEAAKERRDNKDDAGVLARVEGIRYAIRKLKLGLRADGLVATVATLTEGPKAPRGPRNKVSGSGGRSGDMGSNSKAKRRVPAR